MKQQFQWAGLLLLGSLHLASQLACPPTLLTITNKTDSDIDELHFIYKGKDSGDLLGDYEILHPNESFSVKFDCTQIGRNKVTVKLLFDDGLTHTFEDDVCEGDWTWDIVDDGNHQH